MITNPTPQPTDKTAKTAETAKTDKLLKLLKLLKLMKLLKLLKLTKLLKLLKLMKLLKLLELLKLIKLMKLLKPCDLMKMGNIVPRTGIKATTLAFQARVLAFTCIASLMLPLYPSLSVYAASCLRGAD